MLICGGGHYIGGQKDGEVLGHGNCTWSDGSIYSGLWKNGLPDGFGKFQFFSGECFEGEWVNGVRRGIGSWKGSDRSEYHGEFLQCTFHGAGFMLQEISGFVFHGYFENGVRTGNGVVLRDDGYVYAGSFHQDLRHGSALEILSQGDIRVAADVIYERDRLTYRQPRWVSRGGAVRTVSGKVIPKLAISGMDLAFESVLRQRSRPFNLVLEDGSKFTGQTRDQQLDGRGRIVYSADDARGRREYEGSFHDGRHHGVGVMFWQDGSSYCGQWQAGDPGGFGIHTFAPVVASSKSNDRSSSTHSHSLQTRPLIGSIEFPAPYAKYEGGILDGLCHGFGVLSAADGSQFFSKFAVGKSQGYSAIGWPSSRREILHDGQCIASSCEDLQVSNTPFLLAAAVEQLARRAQAVARAVAGMVDSGPAVAAAGWQELQALKWAQLWAKQDLFQDGVSDLNPTL